MYSDSRKKHPKCGEIWMCNLVSKDKNIQSGYRPVFILSNDKNNAYSPTVNIIPLTSNMNKAKIPVHVELWEHGKFGLKKPSLMLVEQTTTVSIYSLDVRIGCISDKAVLEKIWNAITIQFPINQLLHIVA